MNPTVNAVFELLCLFLLASGVFLIGLELRTKFDRTFLYSGLALVLLTVFAMVDIWVLPAVSTGRELIHWTRIQHVLGCAIGVFLVWYLSMKPDGVRTKLVRLTATLAAVAAAVLFLDATMKVVDGSVEPRTLYYVVFVPYMIAVGAILLWLIMSRLKTGSPGERRIALWHLIGFCALLICGATDVVVVSTIGQMMLPVPSFSILGVLGLGFTISLVFTERFLFLIRDRQQAYAKLQHAYTQLQDAAGFRQLGESLAYVTHEIKNCMSLVRGSADLLLMRADLSSDDRRIASNIGSSTERLITFCQDLLNFSKESIVRNKHRVRVYALVQRTIEQYQPDRAADIVLESGWEDACVHLDWFKMQHVFVNLFKNAFEADAQTVRVRAIEDPTGLALEVEDDGKGLDSQTHVDKLFVAFESSKKGAFGTGLGLSLCRTIVECHGGHIDAYSKNLVKQSDGAQKRRSGRGLCIQIVLPVYEEPPDTDPSRGIALVTKGIQRLPQVMEVLQAVGVRPALCPTPEAVVDIVRSGRKEFVLAAAELTPELNKINSPNIGEFVLLSFDTLSTYALRSEGVCLPKLFSEEYVLVNFLGAAEPQ